MQAVNIIEVKNAIGISHSAQDAWLEIMIAGVQEWLETELGLCFTPHHPFTEDLDGTSDALKPRHQPVTCVTSVTGLIDGEAQPFVLSDGLIYRADAQGRLLNYPWTYPVYGFLQPGTPRFRVVYHAGFEHVPAGLKEIMCRLIARRYRNPTAAASTSEAGMRTDWPSMVDDSLRRDMQKYDRRSKISIG